MRWECCWPAAGPPVPVPSPIPSLGAPGREGGSRGRPRGGQPAPGQEPWSASRMRPGPWPHRTRGSCVPMAPPPPVAQKRQLPFFLALR